MRWASVRTVFVGAAAGLLGLWVLVPRDSALKRVAFWQSFASPGALSTAHAHIEHDCAACHTAVSGVVASNCIVCHANNTRLLQRQPTAFHASIGSCRECHLEHAGRGYRPTTMDHGALARIGLRRLGEDRRGEVARWLGNRRRSPNPRITVEEATLDCAACHSNDDPHASFFGTDCAQCHAADTWTIPEFRHPSTRSTDCVQCHQAPPSHYMMHFKMISARVAGKHGARVHECHLCHQTTSWNDIVGVGLYKHH